jgi:Leucine-rich repeat (LRR) protein
MEWDNITELTEELFYYFGPQKVYTLVFDLTQTLSIQKNAFQGMSHLKSQKISNNQLDGMQPGTFRGLQTLTHLSLSNNYIDDLYSRTFEGLQILTPLDLSNNIIEELSREIFDGMIRVNSCKPMETEMMLLQSQSLLDLSFNGIKHIDPGTFLGLCVFTHLSLNNNNLSVLCSDTFQG